MNENEFLLEDRLQKIRQVNAEWDLEKNAYLAFSGGKDSTVTSRILDLALPGNRIPRVFVNTGIEYRAVTEYVKNLDDDRIEIISPQKNIRNILEEYGYPFKSKEHSAKVNEWQRHRGGV